MGSPPKDIHSIFGDLASALQKCTIPKPSIVIDDKYLKFAGQLHDDSGRQSPLPYLTLPPLPTQVSSIPKSSDRPVINLSTPHLLSSSLQTLPTHQKETLHSGHCNWETIQSSENDLLLEPESLLKLLADDAEVHPNSFKCGLDNPPHHTLVNTPYCGSSTAVASTAVDAAIKFPKNEPDSAQELSCSIQPSVQPSASVQPPVQPTVLRIPEYLKVPAKIFPIIIGKESYLLPYKDNNVTVVVAFVVILAAGEYVVAKVMGCGAYHANVSYPENMLLTKDDEIKIIKAKGLADMTIDEQIKYRSMKEQQNMMLANQIEKYNLQQQRHMLQQQTADARPNEAAPNQKRRCTTTTGSQPQPLRISSGLVGTVVKLPADRQDGSTDDHHDDHLGLISYEINDGFATVPFSSVAIPMIGGETVEFDLDLNCGMKKCEAVRIRLAPINANLKNSAVSRSKKQGATGRAAAAAPGRSLSFVKSPPTIYCTDRLKKCGMYGKIHLLPTKNREGVVKYMVGTTTMKAAYRDLPTGEKAVTLANHTVKFDLIIWFDTGNPAEATNVKVTKEDYTRYSSVEFLCEGLPDDRCREWSVEDFRKLMVILKEGNKDYDWKKMSIQMKRSQINLKNFLKIFVSRIQIARNPSATYTKSDLDAFVDHISSKRKPLACCETSKRTRQPSAKENNGSVGANGRKQTARQRSSSAKESTAVSSSPVKPGPKRTKSKSTTDSISADSISKQTSSSTGAELALPSTFTPHQTFVARNLHHWQQVKEVPGERAVNSVLGDVMVSCSKYSATSRKPSKEEGSSTAAGINYAAIYQYLGVLLQNGEEKQLPILSGSEAQILLHLMQDLFEDISKRNLHTHKQFLLQRFFDFTGGKAATRTPINPYKLKGFLLHLPDPRPSND